MVKRQTSRENFTMEFKMDSFASMGYTSGDSIPFPSLFALDYYLLGNSS
jgi:hypothetical protein